MRTKQQTDNLRKAFSATIDPIFFFVSDEFVNRFADKLQRKVDEEVIADWRIKVKLEKDKDKSWEDIEQEPKIVNSDLSLIKRSCQSLLSKHKNIYEILLKNTDDFGEEFLISRQDSSSRE